jgi:hypothetical protein
MAVETKRSEPKRNTQTRDSTAQAITTMIVINSHDTECGGIVQRHVRKPVGIGNDGQ